MSRFGYKNKLSRLRLVRIIVILSLLSINFRGVFAQSDSVTFRQKTPKWLESTVPVALSLTYTLSNNTVKGIRNDLIPTFRSRYDDYLQFAPLATQLGLRFVGVRGASEKFSTQLVADATALGIMMTITTVGKKLTHVKRPDSSAHNSFPSGHTATAFMSAHLLTLEYGDLHPVVAPASYLVASSVALGRILNNRHWAGDVVVGASIGILSAELSYAFARLVTRETVRDNSEIRYLLPRADFRLSLPIAFAQHTQLVGLGLRYKFSPKGYLLRGSFSALKGKKDDTSFMGTCAIGKEYNLISNFLTIEGDIGLNVTHQYVSPSIGVAKQLKISPRLYFEGFASWNVLYPSYSHLGLAWQYRL